MRILFLSETFPDANHPTTGTYNFALCRELSREHEVRVISPRSWVDKMKGQRYAPCLDLKAASISVEYPTRWYTPLIAQQHYGAQMWWSMRTAISRQCHRWKPDAILSYWAHPDGECGLRAAERFGVPCAVIVGGSDVLLVPKFRNRLHAVRRVLSTSDAVITVSDGLREACESLGANPQNVHTIRQGIDPAVFHPGDQNSARKSLGLSIPVDEPLIVWVGRLVGLKRVDLLLNAVRLLKDRGRLVRVALLGSGPARADWEQLSSRLGIGGQVQFIGSVSHHLLPTWYRAADATVLCSDSEGLPNVLRESVACGIPFVSTDVGSVREISSADFSVLVTAGDHVALATGIAQILDGSYRDGAQRYHPRTWKETAHDTAELLKSLISYRHAAATSPALPAVESTTSV